MIVAFQAGTLETLGHGLVPDNAKRGVRAGISASLQLFQPRADFVQDRSLLEATPGCHQAQGRHAMGAGLGGGIENRFAFNQVVTRGVGLVSGRLGAKAAIFRATACLDVDDRTEVNLVALVTVPNAVGPREE